MSVFAGPVFLAWWPPSAGDAPPLDIQQQLDAAPFLSWSNMMAEAAKFTARGRTVRVFVPEADALRIPTGRWDMSGIVLHPVGAT